MIYISEFLLYCSFAILVGSEIIQLVPQNKRPDIKIPRWLTGALPILIISLSFVPLINIANHFYEGSGVHYLAILGEVLFGFSAGHAFLLTVFVAILLLMVQMIKSILPNRRLSYLSLCCTFLLVLAFGWASHCTSAYQLKGFIPHTLHFLAVCIWMGILFVVAWFSTNHHHWQAFLKWFTPVALTCLFITIGSGLFLMNLLVPDYTDAWMVSYGQALLIKHLLVIPLLLFAIINGVWVRAKLKSANLAHERQIGSTAEIGSTEENLHCKFSPIPWVRAESIMGLLVLSAAAVMGQQSPPENLAALLQTEEPSRLFSWFYRGEVSAGTVLQFTATGLSILFTCVAVSLLLAIVYLFRRKWSSSIAVGFALLFVVSAYLAIMLAIQ